MRTPRALSDQLMADQGLVAMPRAQPQRSRPRRRHSGRTTFGGARVGTIIRYAAATAGVLVPATVGYTLYAAVADRRDPRFRRVGAAAISVGEVGLGAVAGAAAGVLALIGRAHGGRWPGAARIAAGLGAGLACAGFGGIATLMADEAIHYPPQPGR